MIRFASIPKCGSRSLEKLGLLGELPGRCHTKIKDYPEWEKYDWYVVTRPYDEWIHSWWMQCKKANDLLAHTAGFEYNNLDEDLAKLSKIEFWESRWGVNQWVPYNFGERYDGDMQKLAKEVIIEDVNCKEVKLSDLDDFLSGLGFEVTHENRDE